ncbi:MAG: hypothetical protein AVDCRST_MAG49-1679, partial [uncultured Thermomicrobiales bacterium]
GDADGRGADGVPARRGADAEGGDGAPERRAARRPGLVRTGRGGAGLHHRAGLGEGEEPAARPAGLALRRERVAAPGVRADGGDGRDLGGSGGPRGVGDADRRTLRRAGAGGTGRAAQQRRGLDPGPGHADQDPVSGPDHPL